MKEHEIKFLLPPTTLKPLQKNFFQSDPLHLTACYFDTPQWELAQNKAALRLRLEDEQWVSENEGAAAVMEQSKDAVAMPSIPEMAEVWDPVATAVQTVATGKSDPEEALETAVQLIKDNIEMNHGGAN